MAEIATIEGIEKILNARFSDNKMSGAEVAEKYERLTGEKMSVNDATKEIIEFVLEAKESFKNLSSKTKEAIDSIELLNLSIKDLFKNANSFAAKEGAVSSGSSRNSVNSMQIGFSKMSDSVVFGTKKMIHGSMDYIKSFFNGVSRQATSFMDKLLSPFKDILNAVMKPFRAVSNMFSTVKKFFGGLLDNTKNLFSGSKSFFSSFGGLTNKTKEIDLDRAGITSKAFNSNVILKHTAVGIAIAWLWKQYSESSGLSAAKSSSGLLSGIKTFFLRFGSKFLSIFKGLFIGLGKAIFSLGSTIISGLGKVILGLGSKIISGVAGLSKAIFGLGGKMISGVGKLLGSITIPGLVTAAGVVGAATTAWDVGKSAHEYFTETDPEKKQAAGNRAIGGTAVAGLAGTLGFLIGGPAGAGIAMGVANKIISPEMQEKIGSSLISMYKGAVDMIKGAWDKIPSWDEFKSGASAAFEKYVTGPISSVFSMLPSWGEFKDSASATFERYIAEPIKSAFSMLPSWDSFKDTASNILSVSIGAPIVAAWNALPAWDTFKDKTAESFEKYISVPLGDLGDKLAGWLDSIKDKLGGWWQNAKDFVKKGLNIDEKSPVDARSDTALALRDKEESKGFFGKLSDKLGDLFSATAAEAAAETPNPTNMSGDQQALSAELLENSKDPETIAAAKALVESIKENVQTDKNINESVFDFSEVIDSLIKPLKKFTETIKDYINSTIEENTIIIKDLRKKDDETKDKATNARNKLQAQRQSQQDSSVPFDEAQGGLSLAGGKFKEKTRFNSVEDAIIETIRRNEGNYTSVNKDDNGAGVSLGFAQWNAERAQDLLKRMEQQDPEGFRAAMGDRVTSSLSDSSVWRGHKSESGAFKFTDAEAKGFRALASREDMQKIQTEKMREDVQVYMKTMEARGITGAKEQIYYADMMHQVGAGGVRTGTGGYTDLENMHDIGRRYDRSKYTRRRDSVYAAVQGMEFVDASPVNAASVELASVQPQTVQVQEGNNALNQLVTAITEATEKSTAAISAKLDESSTKTAEVLGKQQKAETNPQNSSGAIDSDSIPSKIMNFLFGVNPGGNEAENFFINV